MKEKRLSMKKIMTMMIMAVMVFLCIGGGGKLLAAEGGMNYAMDDAIDNVSIMVQDEGGKWQPILQSYKPAVLSHNVTNIDKNTPIKVAISYSPQRLTEERFNVGDTISYKLPAGIRATSNQSGDVYDGPTAVGVYDITTTGQIKITLTNETYMKDTGGKLKDGTVSFKGSFAGDAWEHGGKQEIAFGEVKFTVDFEKPPAAEKTDISITKDGTLHIDNNNLGNSYIDYTIVVKASESNTRSIKNVKVTDKFMTGGDHVSDMTVVSKPDETNVVKKTDNWRRWVWTIGEVKPGETYTLVLRADLNDRAFAEKANIKNNATLEATGEDPIPAEKTISLDSALNITKTNGGYTFANGKSYVTYEVTVKAPKTNDWEIKNVSVVDKFTENKEFVDINQNNTNGYRNIVPQVGTVTFKDGNLVWNIGSMKPNTEVKLTYTVDVKPEIFVNTNTKTGTGKVENSVIRTLKNEARIYLNNQWTNKAKTSTVDFAKTWITKAGTRDGERIKFVIEGNKGNPMLTGDLTFSDRLSGDWVYDGDVTYQKYSVNADGSTTKVGQPQKFTPGSSKSWTKTVQGGYYYEFTYYAKYTGEKIGEHSISNSAGVGIGVGDKTYNHIASWSGTSKNYESLEKIFDRRNGKIATWVSTIETDIPAGSVYTDYKSGGADWTVTPEQVGNIVVKKGNQDLTKGVDYEATWVSNTEFTVKFKTAQTDVTKDNAISITYNTTLALDSIAPGNYAEFINRAKLVTAGGKSTVYADAKCTYLAEKRMEKSAGGYDEENGILTWKIKVNNTGSMSGDATVIDELPDGLEFIDAEIDKNDKGSKAEGTKLDGQPTVSGNFVTINITGLNQTNDTNAYVVIKVRTKVVDKEFLLGNDPKKFVNKATLIYHEGDNTVDYATKEITNESLSKTGKYNEGTAPFVLYTIKINPNGLDMLQEAKTIRITDTMSTNTMLLSDSLKIVNSDTKAEVQPINMAIKNNVFSFDVPDDQPLTVTYSAYVAGEVGSDATISNTVIYEGYEEIPGGEYSNKIEVASSNATIASDPGFYILKTDAYGAGAPLEGTKFTLTGVNSKSSVTGITDKGGKILFTGLSDTEVYYFVETEATANYLIGENSRPTYVAFNKEEVQKAINAKLLPEGMSLESVLIIQPNAILERQNEYNTTTEITFKGTKTLENANYEMEANAYTFELTGPNLKDKDGKAAASLEIGHDAEGNINFPAISYELKELDGADSKTYTYTIKEKAGNAGGVTYSTDVYTVVVTVTKDVQTGKISAAVTDVKKNGGEYQGKEFDFVNTYDAEDVTDVISGIKKTEGLALERGDYTFQMVETTDGVEDPYRATAVNDASGVFSFNLPVYTLEDHGKTFTYEISEVNGEKEGMTYDESVYTVTVTVTDNLKGKMELDIVTELDGETAEFITFTNKFKGSAELTKTNGKDGNALKFLPGAEFKLYRVTETNGDQLVGVFTTGKDGKVKAEDLVEGSYYFVETKAPAGHKIVTDEDGNAKKYRFEIGLKGNSAVVNAKITASNEQKLGTIGLVKKDAETAALIEGAEFSLYKDGVEYQPGLRTDDEGKITVSSLPWGEYWFVETAPAPGYIHDAAETKHVTIDADYVDGDVVVVDKTNKQTEVFVTKTDITGEKEVAGATLEIYRVVDLEDPLEGDNLVPVTSWTSGEEAHLIKGLLAVNETYVLKETIAPAGYGFIKSDIVFTVNADGSITSETAEFGVDEEGNQILLVKDDIIDLKISKTSFATGKKLAGAVLAVYNKETGEEVVKWTSTEEGCYDFGAYLTANETYILKELEAPAGYVKIDDIEFTVENEGQVIILTDSKFVTYVEGHMEVANCPEVPKTGDDFSSGNMLLAMLLAMGGMAVAAIPRRKRQ